MATPQIFVSHSHADNEYCRAFVAALREALGDNDAVWYDEHNLGWGNIRRTIERELEQRQHFVAILSPASVESDWVNDEIDAARGLLREGKMHTLSFVTAMKCDVPRLLRGYKRLELPDGQPYPPQEAAIKAHAVVTDVRTEPSLHSSRDTLPPLGPAPAPANSILAHHLTPTPLYYLGYRGYTIAGVECILPPICPVPAGVFTMGSAFGEVPLLDRDEMPQYPVMVDAFAIGQHPVTVAEYACAVRANALREPPREHPDVDWAKQQAHSNHPVVCVSWNDALVYVRWLANLTGQSWQLPSEAEWEKAARGTDRRYLPWGNIPDSSRCNIHDSGIGTTTAVGSYPTGASPYHVQDMAGNVWEWTSSLYKPYPYRKSDGREYLDSSENRVMRGGTWSNYAIYASTASRNGSEPDEHGNDLGFRLALGVSGSE